MDIVKIYNPANAKNLTEEEVSAMRDLTDDQIEQLAKAYPNQPTGNAYLEYYDKSEPESKQRFALGTWKNLLNLRKLGKSNILPFRFRKGIRYTAGSSIGRVPAGSVKTKVTDLSKDEKIEGLNVAGAVNEFTKNVVELADEILNTSAQEGVDKIQTSTNSELLEAVEAAEKELSQAIEEKAHHMTIKSLEKKVADAKAAAAL